MQEIDQLAETESLWDNSFMISIVSWFILYGLEYISEGTDLSTEFVLAAVSAWVELGPEMVTEFRDLEYIRSCAITTVLQCLKRD